MSRAGWVRRRWPLVGLLVVVLVAAAGIAVLAAGRSAGATVRTQDQFIAVVDGPAHDQHVRLDSTIYLPAHTPAPAVIVSPGFGETKTAVDAQARQFAQRGLVVLAYTPRGFGRSTGQIALNSPDYEIADGKQLIDWLATRPEVTRTAAGVPKVGVTGGSYGGAFSLMLAGYDHRVAAIAPVITYNDLSQALVPNAASAGSIAQNTPAPGAFADDGVFKKAWAGNLFAAGFAGGGGACGRFIAEVCQAYQQIATTGQASQQTIDLLRHDSPVTVTSQITVPTLLVQGEQDTLFGLDQADANARQITAAGGKVKMIWYAGGHDGGAPDSALEQQIGDWLDYQLTGTGTAPDNGFQYEIQGSLRTSSADSSNAEPTIHTVTAADYPGLTGGVTQRQSLPLTGPADQVVLNPPGGSPAAISSFPGLGGTLSAVAARLSTDIPGEYAAFDSRPVSGQLLIAGASTVRLRVGTVPGQPSSGEAVLFAKLYDVAPNGTRSLPGGGVAPIRISNLPANGTPVDVTVTLPGVVQPVQSGHHLELVVSTTDSNYAGLTTPTVLNVQLAVANLSVPVVPGKTGGTPLPWPQIIAIIVLLAICALASVFLVIRRRADNVDPDLTDVPLVLEGISKSYPGGLKAVDDLSFRVEHGQVVGLLGPNGAGKTTALRMLMGLVRPTSGDVRVFGHRIRPGAPVLSRIGSFVEGSGFLPHLSGMANLKLYWQATGRPTEQAGFDEALEIAGLGDAVNRKVGNYSQGMRQRLAIAQSMLGLPDLLVLDEPTNGLDPPQIRDMREVLRNYAAKGRTVLVSSHLLAEVEQTCTHVVVMHKGRLVAAGEVDEIVTGGETSFRVDDAQRAATVLRDLNGIAAVSDVAEEGQVHARLNGVPRSEAITALVQAGIAVDQVGPRGRLEDAFLQLVGGDPK